MDGFILAAGVGSRLRPYTDDRPKPMLEIAGRPILEHNVRSLVRAGVRRIFMNTHYRPDVIREHFGNGSRFGAEIVYLHEDVLLGTAGAVLAARTALRETFILVYGDNLSGIRLDRMLDEHRRAAGIATIALFSRPDVLNSGIVGFDEDGRITRFLEKPRAPEVFSNWVNAGTIIMEPLMLDAIPTTGPSDWGRDIFPALLDQGERLQAYFMRDEPLWWIDTEVDYERTRTDPAIAAALRA